jgi:hypothetical protein
MSTILPFDYETVVTDIKIFENTVITGILEIVPVRSNQASRSAKLRDMHVVGIRPTASSHIVNGGIERHKSVDADQHIVKTLAVIDEIKRQ